MRMTKTEKKLPKRKNIKTERIKKILKMVVVKTARRLKRKKTIRMETKLALKIGLFLGLIDLLQVFFKPENMFRC